VTSFDQAGALPAAIVAVGFAILARVLRSVTEGGALAGALIAFLLMNAGGLWAFLPLIVVFVLTLLATRWGSERKRGLGIAERSGGRKARQVLANLAAAGLCSIASSIFPRQSTLLMVGTMTVLAEAAADTVSSEVGQAVAGNPRMILGFSPAPPGTNGAISLEGTFAGCIAASIVSWTAALAGVVELRWAPIITFAGVAGMLFDSVLGATLENRGKMGNDAVNFVSTVFAADLALFAALVLKHG
jgi:uncharacterized protein (TIGR00297 family)